MSQKSFFYSILLLSIFMSCSPGRKEIQMFPSPAKNTINLSCINSSCSKIIIDTTLRTSYQGKAAIHNNVIYFVDFMTCSVVTLDTMGKVLDTKLGSGKSRSETTIGEIYSYAFATDGSLYLQGGSDDIHVYDSSFKFNPELSYRKQRERYAFGEKIAFDAFELYSMGYPPVCRHFENSLFTNNRAEDPTFNYFETPDIFVKEFRSITEQNLKTKKTGRLLGKGLPPIYNGNSDRHYLFSSVFFDIDKQGNFYVTYMADSLIYKYDKNYDPICSFGFDGQNMDKTYIRVLTIQDIQSVGINQLYTKGYYNWIEYIDEMDCIVRSYSKGQHAPTDGLQLYRENKLIADIDVPKKFKPIGYIAPYIYSDVICDDENNAIYFYKLKIDNLQ